MVDSSTFADRLKEINDAPVPANEPTKPPSVGPYGIAREVWGQWAAAAGYPGARWDDPYVMDKVVSWVSNKLFSEFGNWALVAIGWRYGAPTARKIQDLYGGTPAQPILDKLLGTAGARFVNDVYMRMEDTTTVPANFTRHSSSQAGDIELQFRPETRPDTPVASDGLDPRAVLRGVLGSMADRIAPGKRRLTLEEALAMDRERGASNITPEDTAHMDNL